jgi:hypothetical protein
MEDGEASDLAERADAGDWEGERKGSEKKRRRSSGKDKK